MAVIEKTTGHYCTECEALCYGYNMGMACHCENPWECEVEFEADYPEKWIKVDIEISKQTGNDESD